MNQEEYEILMKKIAKENGLELTENAYKIARFRERTQLPMDKCPCEQNAKDRGCIGSKCWEEINRDGICLCQCFKKKGK